MRRMLLLVVLLAAGPVGVAGQVALETEPALPVRGTLFRLRVSATADGPVDRVGGEIAGEPLHFDTADGTFWQALAAAPIDGGDSLAVLLTLHRGAVTDTVRTSIATGAGSYRSEKLSVAPSMAEPDSAARVRIADDNARARAVSRESHETPRLWKAPFARPRPTRVTSAFGTARVFNGAVASRHMGTDFSGAVGAPVRAAARGRVALVAEFYLAGHVVYLDHGHGLVTAYFHLSRTLVKQGEMVEQGQQIGAVGQTGRVTGPHLHWIMRYGRITVDPLAALALLNEPMPAGE